MIEEVHEGVSEALEIILPAMVLPFEGVNRTSKRCSLELRLILLVVLATLLVLVLRHDPKIYHPHMTAIIHSEVVQLNVLVQQFCFGVQ